MVGQCLMPKERVTYRGWRDRRTVFGTKEEVPKTKDEHQLAGNNNHNFKKELGVSIFPEVWIHFFVTDSSRQFQHISIVREILNVALVIQDVTTLTFDFFRLFMSLYVTT